MSILFGQTTGATPARMTKYMECLGIALCILCAVLSIAMTFQNRTLWPDEAMLVWNVETRTWSTLTASPLDMRQTAPALYLYCLKLASSVLGHAEWAYRLPAALAYAFLPLAIGWTARRLFRLSHPWLCAGFCANLKLLLVYSNQVKPYMGEAILVLLALAAFDCFLEGKLPWWGLAIAWVLSGLCGNPVWFAVAGCLGWAALRSLLRRDSRVMLRCLAPGALFGLCMAVYWVFWLAPVAHSSFMQGYWGDQTLSWPFSPSAILHDGKILWVHLATQVFGVRAFYICPLIVGSILFVAKAQHRWGAITWLTLGCAGGASCLGMFPIGMRLWVFALPLVSLLAVWTLENLAGARWMAPAGMLLAAMALANMGIVRWNPTNNYLWGRELNDAMAYVEEHLRDGESVYFPAEAFARGQYKNGIGNRRMGHTSRDNVIFGEWLETDAARNGEVARVESTGVCWLPMANRLDASFMEALAKSGTVESKRVFQGTVTSFYRNNGNALNGNGLSEAAAGGEGETGQTE